MGDELEKVEMVKQWCDGNLTSAVGLRRIDLEQFNDV